MALDNLCLCLLLLTLIAPFLCDAAEHAPATEQSKGEDKPTNLDGQANHETENKEPEESQQSEFPYPDGDSLPAGMKIEYIVKVEGCNKRPTPLDALQVHFSARVVGGEQLDSSYEINKGEPLKVMLRKKNEMNEAEKVMLGLCEGEKIRMFIPARILLGDAANAEVLPFPIDSTLDYIVEMVSITEPPLNEDTFEIIDGDGDGQVTQEEFKNHLKDVGLEAEGEQMAATYFGVKDKNKDNIITMEEMLAPVEEESASDEGKSTPDEGKSAPDEGKSTSDEGKSAPDERKSAPDEGKPAPDEGKSAPDEGKSTSDEGKLASDERKSAPDEGKSTSDGGKSTSDEGKPAPDEGKSAPDEGKPQHQEL